LTHCDDRLIELGSVLLLLGYVEIERGERWYFSGISHLQDVASGTFWRTTGNRAVDTNYLLDDG